MNMKPHIYWSYYPKLRRGFWRVSLLPKPHTTRMKRLWREANDHVHHLNRGVSMVGVR